MVYVVTFKQWTCRLMFHRYQVGDTVAIKLVEQGSGEPIATATVNIPDLDSNEVAVKDYSENQGMLQVLIEAGVVHTPHRIVSTGFVTIPVCFLSQSALQQIDFN